MRHLRSLPVGLSNAGGGAGSGGISREIKVYSRPAKVESEDLMASVEALTTHHISVEELLGVSAVYRYLGGK